MKPMQFSRVAWLATPVALLAACLFDAPAAHAYRLIGAVEAGGTGCSGFLLECGDDDTFARWWNYPVAFWVNEDADADAAEGDYDQSDILDIAQAAYQVWEDVPFSIITFAWQGETSNRLAGLDRQNVTMWYNPAFDMGACAGACGAAGGTIAITVLTEVEQSGEIIDADIIMDSADDFSVNAGCVGFDAQSVLTHEYGHSIGIHHTELDTGVSATQPTMFAFVFCDAGIASGRSLEPDDEGAAQCLYPELPTVILMDQTGSMCIGDRMGDAQDAANSFIDLYASNVMAVSAFAEGMTAECGGCVARPGYELLQDWTDNAALLHAAINGTSACGFTPLWESVCCAITEAETSDPSNLLIFTDTGENSSNGTCGCHDFPDVLALADAADDVAVYVIDMTNYFGAGPSPLVLTDTPNPSPLADQSTDLETLAGRTGGIYVRADAQSMLTLAVQQVSEHMARMGKLRQGAPDCNPDDFAIDDIQRYTGGSCTAASPFLGQTVQIKGVVTAKRGTWDANTQYIEDCSGGIQVTTTTGPIGNIGDVVSVVGTVGSIFGELRLEDVQQYTLQGHLGEPQTPIVDPAVGQTCESIGSLMSVRGYVDGPVQNFRFQLVSDLGTSSPQKLTVFLDPDTGIDPAEFVPGELFVVRGILSHRLGQNELKPRMREDIQSMSSTDVEPVATTSITGLTSLLPNPTRGTTALNYSVPKDGPVRIDVFDAQGRLLRNLVDRQLTANQYQAEWDGRTDAGEAVASGLYFVRFRGPDGVAMSRTLVMVR